MAPIASGSLYTKLDSGYRELLDAGLVDGEPRRGLRRAGRGLLARRHRLRRGVDEVRPVRPDTIAKSLAIGAPADGDNALGVARRTGGQIAAVSDDEIVEAIGLLARTTGIFTETAGGVTVADAGAAGPRGPPRPRRRTVAYITGDGLKTPDAALAHVNPISIEADIDAVDAILDPVGVR